jgi:hypothetical protein
MLANQLLELLLCSNRPETYRYQGKQFGDFDFGAQSQWANLPITLEAVAGWRPDAVLGPSGSQAIAGWRQFCACTAFIISELVVFFS